MAGTKYNEIFDLFMVQIKDWRLQNLFETSVDDFETYLSGFLSLAIPDFVVCTQSLGRDDETREFDLELSHENKSLLAQLMVEKWLEKEVQDVKQMNLHIQDKDFKVYSEAQNLKEKSLHLDKVKEYNSLRMNQYSYNYSTNWENWLSGNFFPG